MRVPTNLSRAGLGFNMTPMIDVVFQLIIFFLVSSHLVQQETQMEAEELNLPKADSGQPTEEDQVRRVVVNVVPDPESGGHLMVGGQQKTREELHELIRYGTQADRQMEVRIRADRTVPYRVVEPVMVDCARAGVWKVTFAVVEGPAER
ncbi:MAG: ExbD/TolR family protein [Planctomycetota bacterium]|jgi:biopolymer transport protein ExbD